eukprot:COSAG02_NODE_4695_length_5086_cov_2.667135_1_plen_88_part_00
MNWILRVAAGQAILTPSGQCTQSIGGPNSISRMSSQSAVPRGPPVPGRARGGGGDAERSLKSSKQWNSREFRYGTTVYTVYCSRYHY